MAVDIGTTTVVAALIDLGTARKWVGVLAESAGVHAQDVLSRVKLGSTPDGLSTLHGEIAAEIDRLIGVLAFEARISRRRIYEVVLAGNTCMLHLAANVEPRTAGALSLHARTERRPSYRGQRCGPRHIPVRRGLYSARRFGFVGADITAGMLSTNLAELKGVTLFVDIGTNGEMALARDGHLQATSTAAGPAFEGMNIACGMRAAEGAIERVSLEGGDVQVKTIGNAPAIGLCGSGLLDAVAELATHGVIESSGRFTKNWSRLPHGLQARFATRTASPSSG